MAQRLVDLLRQPTLARHMGEAGRRIAEHHSHARSVTLHEGVYQALIPQSVPVAIKNTDPSARNPPFFKCSTFH